MVVGSTVESGIFGLPQNMAVGGGAGAIVTGSVIQALHRHWHADACLVYQMLVVRKPELDNGIYAYARALAGDYLGFNAAWGYWLNAWIGDVGYLVAAFSLAAFC